MNDNGDFVSVALATYEGSKYLSLQIESILTQTHLPDEIVICDDASSDDTMDIIRQFYKKYPNLIRYCQNEKNLGYIKNFEKALSLCKGKYIFLCDQDDIWVNNRIDAFLSHIGNNDLIYSNSIIIDSKGHKTGKLMFAHAEEFSRFSFMDFFLRKGLVQGASMMISDKILKKSIPFPETIPHDIWLMSIALQGKSVVYHTIPTLLYRQHDNNVIGKVKSKRAFSSYLRDIKYLIPRRNEMIRYFYNKCVEFSKLDFLSLEVKRDLVEIKSFCEMMLFPNRLFQFNSFAMYIKLYPQLKKVDNDLFYIPFLRLLSSFYTPYINIDE